MLVADFASYEKKPFLGFLPFVVLSVGSVISQAFSEVKIDFV